jgi:hypothetical protein
MKELLSIFPKGTVGWVTAFDSTDRPEWTGKPARPDRLPDFDGLNAYYSTAGFERGVRSRRVDEMIGAAVVVIDDPTTKGDAADLLSALGEPSYKVQTSRGSQQWGYMLEEPAGNESALPVLQRITSLGLGDRSGNNAIRYARLPCGINNKPVYGETFRVHCVSWDPGRRFRIEDIAAALGTADGGTGARPDDHQEQQPDQSLEQLVRSGESYHDPVLKLAGKWIAQGHDPETVKARLRELMQSCSDEQKSTKRWRKTFDDIDRNVESAVGNDWAPKGRRSTNDFVAYLPNHAYLFIPTGSLWPASSVDACVTWPTQGGKSMRPSAWLDRNRPVHAMTWHPGEPILIEGKVAVLGGWNPDANATTVNLYLPPRQIDGTPAAARPWLDHVAKAFPDDVEHIVRFFAHRVQRPGDKINHALVLAGDQGIGKDTLLEPLKRAVGEWNFAEVGPKAILGDFNGFVKSVVLRISEARDLGPSDRFSFYEHMKVYTAAPPDTIRCNEKHLREHYVFNVMAVVITTNHKSDGIYLPQDDRRHYVAMSHLTKADFDDQYWQKLWRWYEDKNGFAHVAAYLRAVDLSDFDPKAPPPKTPAWHAIVAANHAPEDMELSAVIEDLDNPDALTLEMLRAKAPPDLHSFLTDPKTRKAVGHRLSALGYAAIANPDAKSGLWRLGGNKSVVYAKRTLTPAQAYVAIRGLPIDEDEDDIL